MTVCDDEHMYKSGTFADLIGKQLDGISVSEDGHYLCITTRDEHGILKNHEYETRGDCCSETWIADIFGGTFKGGITAAQALELRSIEDLPYELPGPVPDGALIERLFNPARTRQDIDLVYGFQLGVVGKGAVTIIFRNSSNGYYGGDLMRGSIPPDARMVPITTDDWSL